MVVFFTGLLVLLFMVGNAGAAGVINGDFANDLVGWIHEGDVKDINQEAVLGDNNTLYSVLYQSVVLTQGRYVLTFDFKNALSNFSPEPPFVFFDVFFASLYFSNDPLQFNVPDGRFETVIPLFDMDYEGPFDISGEITSSPKGPGWYRFRIVFENTYPYATPVFELFNLNFVNNDSHVSLDNVSIDPYSQQVPSLSENGTIVFAIALLFLGLGSMKHCRGESKLQRILP
jgi:hypothetical protein